MCFPPPVHGAAAAKTKDERRKTKDERRKPKAEKKKAGR